MIGRELPFHTDSETDISSQSGDGFTAKTVIAITGGNYGRITDVKNIIAFHPVFKMGFRLFITQLKIGFKKLTVTVGRRKMLQTIVQSIKNSVINLTVKV